MSFSCDPAAHALPVERSAGLVLSSRQSITNEEASDAIAKAQHVVDVIERAIAVELEQRCRLGMEACGAANRSSVTLSACARRTRTADPP
jgi:hypothetical protein